MTLWHIQVIAFTISNMPLNFSPNFSEKNYTYTGCPKKSAHVCSFKREMNKHGHIFLGTPCRRIYYSVFQSRGQFSETWLWEAFKKKVWKISGHSAVKNGPKTAKMRGQRENTPPISTLLKKCGMGPNPPPPCGKFPHFLFFFYLKASLS